MSNTEKDKELQQNMTNKNAESPKKGISGYALFRRIMMLCFAVLFVVFITISIMFLVRNYKANKSNGEVMGDFNEITNGGTVPDGDSPIIISPETTPAPESSAEASTEGDTVPTTPPDTPAATEPPIDEAYLKYVAECIEEAKRLKELYPDFRAIIVIEGDTINLKYPILQSTDNTYYVEHLIDGSKNSTGEIFLDCRNDGKIINNRNSVIYGHNMNDGTKFGQIHKYKHNGAFYTHNITVITDEAVYTFKPFSFYKTDIYNPYTTVSFADDAAFAEFCEAEQERSMFASNIEFTGGERIITLSTCYGTSLTERYCLHAVLINVAK